MSIPSWFVIVMGLGTVFIGLLCVVLLCKILGAVCSLSEGKTTTVPQSHAPVAAPVAQTNATTPSATNRGEIIAAIGVAIAEEIGVDANAIRITSIKRVN